MISAQTARRRGLTSIGASQTAEIHLRHLAGRALSHPDSRGTPPPPAPPYDEPPQRRVRDPAAPARKQLLDAGHLQPVGSQPLVDLLGPGGEHLLGRRLNPPGARNTQPRQAGQLLLARSRTVTGQAHLHHRIDVPADCRARQPVPVAICRWLMPDCQRRTTSAISTLDTSLYAIAAPYIQSAAMVAVPAPRVVNLLVKWPIVPGV